MIASPPPPVAANVVAIGRFNPAIITPDWLIATGLVEAGPAELELAIGDQENVVRHKVQGFVITATPRRLQIDSPPNNVLGAADLLSKILSQLAHTPVTVVGLNFYFANDAVPLAFAPDSRLSSVGNGVLVEANSRVTRRLPDGRHVQVQLVRDATKAQIQINLQTSVKDARGAMSGLALAGSDLVLSQGLAAQVLKSRAS